MIPLKMVTTTRTEEQKKLLYKLGQPSTCSHTVQCTPDCVVSLMYEDEVQYPRPIYSRCALLLAPAFYVDSSLYTRPNRRNTVPELLFRPPKRPPNDFGLRPQTLFAIKHLAQTQIEQISFNRKRI